MFQNPQGKVLMNFFFQGEACHGGFWDYLWLLQHFQLIPRIWSQISSVQMEFQAIGFGGLF